jgi:Ca-activated chloride channel family protein
MISFAHILFFYALAVIPGLIIVYIISVRIRRKNIQLFAEKPLFLKLNPEGSLAKKNTKFILALIALTFIIFAIIDPRTGGHLENVEQNGTDIVIALDVSNSMNAQDIAPSRLERSKQAIEMLIGKMKGDRIGMVVFAGQPFIQLPLTTDYSAAKMFLQTINTNMVPVQGTAIGAAIDMSESLFAEQEGNASSKRGKSIILITDGENFEDSALMYAANAAANGIVINTVGMGSPDGAPIPIMSGGQVNGFKKDKDGKTVITKLDINLLEQIAQETGGICVRATTSDGGLDKVYEQIQKLNKSLVKVKKYRDYDEQFEIFVALALILLIIDVFVSEKKTKWYQNLNLFGNANQK